jgi:hypothetical protein
MHPSRWGCTKVSELAITEKNGFKVSLLSKCNLRRYNLEVPPPFPLGDYFIMFEVRTPGGVLCFSSGGILFDILCGGKDSFQTFYNDAPQNVDAMNEGGDMPMDVILVRRSDGAVLNFARRGKAFDVSYSDDGLKCCLFFASDRRLCPAPWLDYECPATVLFFTALEAESEAVRAQWRAVRRPSAEYNF